MMGRAHGREYFESRSEDSGNALGIILFNVESTAFRGAGQCERTDNGKPVWIKTGVKGIKIASAVFLTSHEMEYSAVMPQHE